MCKLLLGAMALIMLGFAVYMHVAAGLSFADVALGYAAGLMVAGCAFCVHRFYKKGEVR